jgi:hypothetical protein
MSMKKPIKPAREYISPSDLTFGLSTCKRCLWIKYWYKVSAPLQMPLVGTLSTLQEEKFHKADMPTIDATLRPGTISKWGEFVKSKPLRINDDETRWRILGKYDLVATNTDGTIGLIDCKVSDSQRDSGAFYSPQLEAYSYALENPAAGKGQTVASQGLLIWKFVSAIGDEPSSYAFSVDQKYVAVERDTSQFLKVIEDFINVLEAELPEPGSECTTCMYLASRNALDSL